MNFRLASLATKVLREKSCKVKSCVLRDARLVPTIARTQMLGPKCLDVNTVTNECPCVEEVNDRYIGA